MASSTDTPAPRRKQDPLIGTTIAGRYKILATLGKGGAGQVYRAVQLGLERQVALKVIRTDIQEHARDEFLARFKREASLAGRLSHPNVVTVHDFGTTDDGMQFVVMELLEGRSLKKLVRERGPMDPVTAALFAEGIARGLRHAHAKGMVHRDVKPSNVLVVPTEDGQRPMLLDFGLVKSQQGGIEVTTNKTYLGTPAFMAPEQAKGGDVDGRSDIYSLGCMLYYMVSGELPYQGDSPLEVSLAHLQELYPELSERGVEVPGELEDMIRRCMEKHPDDRFQDVGELADALRTWRRIEIGETTGPTSPTLAPGPAPTEPPGPSRKGIGVAAVVGVGILLAGAVAAVAVAVGVGMWAASTGSVPEEEPGLAMVERPDPENEVEPRNEVEPEPDVQNEVEDEPVARPSPRLPEPEVVEPEPEPEPEVVEPKPEPEPEVVEPEVVEPEPEVVEPEPEPPAPSGEVLIVDDVEIPADLAPQVLEYINTASKDELKAAGVWALGAWTIDNERPFESLDEFARTKNIGTKTVQAVVDAVR